MTQIRGWWTLVHCMGGHEKQGEEEWFTMSYDWLQVPLWCLLAFVLCMEFLLAHNKLFVSHFRTFWLQFLQTYMVSDIWQCSNVVWRHSTFVSALPKVHIIAADVGISEPLKQIVRSYLNILTVLSSSFFFFFLFNWIEKEHEFGSRLDLYLV